VTDTQAAGRPALPSATGWELLAPARQRAGLTMPGLYLRYLALGGSATARLLARHFSSGEAITATEHNLAVLALNERFLELNEDERLSYLG
jgi:hypothetical protein